MADTKHVLIRPHKHPLATHTMPEQKPIAQNFQIGERVLKKSASDTVNSRPNYAPLIGTVTDTRVKAIKTKKGYTRRRFYDVIFEGRSSKPEKNVWSHMLQKIEQEETK